MRSCSDTFEGAVTEPELVVLGLSMVFVGDQKPDLKEAIDQSNNDIVTTVDYLLICEARLEEAWFDFRCRKLRQFYQLVS